MRKKMDNNNLISYFMEDHRNLPTDYLESCEKFLKEISDRLKKEKEKHEKI